MEVQVVPPPPGDGPPPGGGPPPGTEVVRPNTAPSSAPAAAPVQRFSIASDSETGFDSADDTFRDFRLNRFPKPVDLVSADEFTDAESYRFSDPFNATPSRNLPAESPDEQESELQNNVREAGTALTRVANSATSILQNQIIPAARQVVATGNPYHTTWWYEDMQAHH